MPVLLNFFLAVLVSVLDVGGMLVFLAFFLKLKTSKGLIWLWGIFGVVGLLVSVQVLKNTGVNLVLTLLVLCLAATFFAGSLLQKVCVIAMQFMTAMVIDAIAAEISVYIGACVMSDNMEYVIVDRLLYYIMALISKGLPVLLFGGMRLVLGEMPHIQEVGEVRMQYGIMLGNSILCVGITLVMNQLYFAGEVDYSLCTFINICVLAIQFFIYLMYYQMWRVYGMKLEKRAIEDEYRYKQEYFCTLEEHQQEIRTLRHDMKNRLIGILAEMKDREGTEREIRAIMDEIAVSEKAIFSENPAVNSVINAKLYVAKSMGIECSMDIKVPAKLQMSSGDLGILLGNLLDNAIEAAQKCEESRRQIWLKMYLFHKGLVISCTNTTPHRVVTLKTTKEDRKNHGIGLKSVDNILAKYSGERQTWADVDRFRVEINLWI